MKLVRLLVEVDRVIYGGLKYGVSFWTWENVKLVTHGHADRIWSFPVPPKPHHARRSRNAFKRYSLNQELRGGGNCAQMQIRDITEYTLVKL
jgi:hypothetical protein